MLRTQLEAVNIQKADLEKQISSFHSGVQNAVQEYQKRLAESAAKLTETEQQLVIERLELCRSYQLGCQLRINFFVTLVNICSAERLLVVMLVLIYLWLRVCGLLCGVAGSHVCPPVFIELNARLV